jgi:hypothetical protein
VRFGATSDVDEEIERRGGPHQPPSSPQQQHAQPSAMRNSLDSGNYSSSLVLSSILIRNYRHSPGTSSWQAGKHLT